MIPLGVLASARVAPAGGTSPTFIGRTSLDAKAATSTFTAVSLGAAHASRVIVAVITHNATDNSTITSATIGGVAATIDAQTVGGKSMGVIRAAVPTGTTGDVVVNYSNVDAGPGRTCAVYRLQGTVTVASTATDTPTGATTATATLTNSGSWAVAGVGTFNVPTATLSWTNATENYDVVVGASFFPSAVSGASATGTGASLAITATCTSSTSLFLVAAGYNIA